LAMSAVKGLMRLASAGISAAKSIASGAWNAALGTLRSVNASINSIGSSMQTIGKRVAMAGGGMVALGAAITVPLTKAAQQFKALGNRIDGLTEKYRHFGVTAETMSVYAYAASQATGRLGQMGEEERINNLMQSMKTGSAEFAQWTKQAGAAGAIMGGDGVKSAMSLTVAYNRLQGALSGLWVQLGSAVAPAIENSTEIMVGAIRGVTNWVMQNKQLIATVFKVAAAVGAAGTAIAAAGGALAGLGTILTPVTAALAVIAGGMAVVEYRTKAGATLWGSYKNSVVGLYKTFVENVRPIVEEAQKVIGGVISAIKGGDLALAAKIAWGGLKLAWLEGMLWLSDKTDSVFGSILSNLATGNWKAAADGAMGMIMIAFLQLEMYASRVWMNILNFVDGIAVNIMNAFDTALTAVHASWMRMTNYVKKLYSSFVLWMSKLFVKLGGVFDTVVNAIYYSWVWMVNLVKASAAALAGWVGGVWITIKDGFNNMVSAIRDSWDWMLDTMKTAVVKFTEAASGFWSSLRAGFDKALTSIHDSWVWTLDTMKGIASSFSGWISGMWSRLRNGFGEEMGGAIGKFMDMVTSVFLRLKGVALRGWAAVQTSAEGLWNGLLGGFDTAMDGIEAAWIRMLDTLKSWGKSFIAWINVHVFKPIADAAFRLDPTGMVAIRAQRAHAAIQNAQLKIGNAMREAPDAEQRIVDLRDESAKRQEKRASDAEKDKVDREIEQLERELEIEDQIAAINAASAAAPARKRTEEERTIDRLKEELAALQEVARAKEDDLKNQPDDMKVGKLEGSVTTSAFAFGQFARPQDDMKTVAAEATRTRIAQETAEKQQAIRDDKAFVQRENTNRLLTTFGFFGP